MKKIKVGILILSNSWGGAETSMLNIAKNIDKQSFDVYVLANDFLYPFYESLENVRVVNLGELDSINWWRKIITINKIQSKLFKLVKDLNLDVVHAQLENSILALETPFRRRDFPAILTLAGDETRIYHAPQTFEQKIIRSGINRLFRKPNSQVTSVSSWLMKEFDQTTRAKIIVTPNGVDTEFFKANPAIKSLSKVILYVGRLVSGKGVEDLVTVAGELPDYEFWFVGKGSLSKSLTPPNTKYLGFKQKGELIDLYSKATICVFPSYAEGMPVVGLEAMACGKAVVASHHGFSEYIQDGKDGLIIEPGNIGQIRQSITTLIENHELRREIETAAKKRAVTYDIRQTVQNYEKLYQEMAN